MTDRGKKKEIPIKEVEKSLKTACSKLDAGLKSKKIHPKLAKQICKRAESVAKSIKQQARKKSDKNGSVDPIQLQPAFNSFKSIFDIKIKLKEVFPDPRYNIPDPFNKDRKFKLKIDAGSFGLDFGAKYDAKKGVLKPDSFVLRWKFSF